MGQGASGPLRAAAHATIVAVMRFLWRMSVCLALGLSVFTGCARVERLGTGLIARLHVDRIWPGTWGAKPPEALDKTTETQLAAAQVQAPPKDGRDLGQVVASLGSPAEPGFWLRTALVTEAAKGFVSTDTGATLAVDLIPDAGGARMSLAAYRALNLPLTALPVLTVTQAQ